MNPSGVGENLTTHYLKVQALSPASPITQPTAAPSASLDLFSALTSWPALIFIGLITITFVALLIVKVKNTGTLISLMLMVLVAGAIPVSVGVVNQQTRLQSQAGPETTPKNVVVANVSPTAFTILWDTDKSNVGTIRVHTSPQMDAFAKIYSEDDQDGIYKHFIRLENLTPSTDYYIEILSSGMWYNHNGTPLKVTTPAN
jgi:hypothetical protein